ARAGAAAEGDVIDLGPLRGAGGPNDDRRDGGAGEPTELRGRAGDRRRADDGAAGVERFDRRNGAKVVEVDVEADRVDGRVEVHHEVGGVLVVADPDGGGVEAARVRNEDVRAGGGVGGDAEAREDLA